MRTSKSLFSILTIAAALAMQVHAQTCVPPPPGLVAWWPMDGTVRDIVGTNQPSATNALSFVSGEVGPAVSLGSGGYIDIPPSPSLESQQFTWEAWVRWDGPGPTEDPGGSIILENTLNPTFGYALSARASDHRFVFCCGGDAIVPPSLLVSSNTFSPGRFYHVTGSYDGAHFNLYINGSLQGQLASVSALNWGNFWSLGANPAIGRNAGYPRTWNGVIDEVCIYNRALSPTEIASIYAAGSAGKCKLPALTLIKAVTIKAVTPSFSNLFLKRIYQLQVSSDMSNWTNQGSPFTATNTSMIYPQYWDVDNWNQLFFRLQVPP